MKVQIDNRRNHPITMILINHHQINSPIKALDLRIKIESNF
jgi:hypothetical protein